MSEQTETEVVVHSAVCQRGCGAKVSSTSSAWIAEWQVRHDQTCPLAGQTVFPDEPPDMQAFH